MRPVRPLVISHSGEATGAGIALLRIMRWCVSAGAVEPIFVLRSDGALADEFRELGRTVVYSERTERVIARETSRLPGGGRAERAARSVISRWLRGLCRREGVELIYVNTATQGRMVPLLAPLGLPFVAHVHELEPTVVGNANLEGLKALIAHSERVFAASNAVERMLVKYGAGEGRIIEVQEPVEEQPLLSAEERVRLRRDLLNADGDAIVVATCGLPGWRKGTDIFFRVAQGVLAHGGPERNVLFRWIGGRAPNDALATLASDAAHFGLTGYVDAIGDVRRADRLLGAADIVVSTSREDPNPLVVLEAAAAGRPVVCFEEAGGAEELAKLGAAIAVPYLDVDAMVHAVLTLAISPGERRRLGEVARTVVLRRNAVDVVGAQVSQALLAVRQSRSDRLV